MQTGSLKPALAYLLALCLLLPAGAVAQSGRVEALLERQLSGDGRVVEIDGFAGVLTAQATMDALRIADADGVWLELEDAALDWDRGALLSGRLDVRALTAARLRVLRAPKSEPQVPSAEASGFRIPELPIAINVGRFAIERLELGEALLGQAVTAQIEANARLDDAGLAVVLSAARRDAQAGEITLDLGYDRADETFRILTRINEPSDGILASTLGMPGTPAVTLDVDGDGPLTDFSALIALATDGTDRFGGRVSVTAEADGQRFQADLSGDIRPMLDPETRAFFGPETALQVDGRMAADGALHLTALDLRMAQLRLRGSGRLGSDRAPERLDLTAEMRGDGPVSLPGSDVTLDAADLRLGFEAANGPDWTLSGVVNGVDAGGITLERAILDGLGQILPGTETPFRGTLSMQARGVDAPSDPALAQVIGPDLRLATQVVAEADGAIALRELQLTTPHGQVLGDLSLRPTDGRAQLQAELAGDLPDLTPFGGLAGLPLAGALTAQIGVAAELPGGAISVDLSGQSQSLDIGQPVIAPLLSPETQLDFAARRDETGTRIDRLSLQNTEVTLRASGSADDADGALDINTVLRDGSFLDPRLAGPLDLTGTLRDVQNTRAITAELTTAFGLQMSLIGALSGDAAGLRLSGTLDDVDRFAAPLQDQLALDGRLDLTAPHPLIEASVAAKPGVTARISGPVSGPDAVLNIAAKIADLADFAPPLPGPADLTGRLDLSGAVPTIDTTISAQPGITAQIAGAVTGPDAVLDIAARIADLAPLVPQLPGPASVDARLSDPTGALGVEARITARPGIQANITGKPLGQNGQLTLEADVADLSPWVSALPGPARLRADLRDLTGALRIAADLSAARGVAASLQGAPLGPDGALDLVARLDNLGVFVPQFPGAARLEARLSDLTGAQDLSATFSGPDLEASLTGALGAERDTVMLDARVGRLNRLTPALTGGANLNATASNLRQTPQIEAALRTDTGASANVAGQVGLPGGAVALNIAGDLPLALAAPFVGDRALSGGASFDLRLAGPAQVSSVSGQVQVSNGRLFDPATGLTLTDLAATADLQASRAALNVQGAVNGGALAIDGSVGLAAPFQTDLTLRLADMIYALDAILRTRVGAALQLRGPATQQLAVAGQIDLFDTEIRVPDTGLGGAAPIPPITHQGASAGARRTQSFAGVDRLEAAQSGGATGPRIPLDLTITARDPIFVRGRGLDAAFDGALQLGGTASAPEPVGQFNLQRGRLDFLGRRLDLTEGRIIAAGAAVPRLRVVAETVIDALTAQIIVEGPADQPEITVTSVPELPQDEVLARLLFGRSFDTLSPFQIARLVASIRTLSGSGGGLIDGTRQRLGFDDLDIRTDEATGETELSFGRRVTEDVYSEVEVDSKGDVQLNLNLDVGRNTRLRGSVSNTGETGLGVFWERDY